MRDLWIHTYDETGAERTVLFSGRHEEAAIDTARRALETIPKFQLENFGHRIAAVSVYDNETDSEIYVAAQVDAEFPAFSDFVMR